MLALSLVLAATCLGGRAWAGIEAGWFGLGGDPALDWVPAPDPQHISGLIQFRCVMDGLCEGSYDSAVFTIEVIVGGTLVDSWDEEGYPAGGEVMAASALCYNTARWPDATWRVRCVATYQIPPEGPIGEPTFGTETYGPTSFGTKNLSVDSVNWSTSDPDVLRC